MSTAYLDNEIKKRGRSDIRQIRFAREALQTPTTHKVIETIYCAALDDKKN